MEALNARLGSLDLDSLGNYDGVRGLMKFFNQQKKKFTVSVEGNIGCGKSTMLNYFESFVSTVEAVKEPIEMWTNIRGHNALYLYEDPERWSFMFNHYSFLTRADMHSRPTNAPVKMLERSLFSARHVFVENGLKSGVLSEVEHAILHEWFTFICTTQRVKVDLFVYLRASPEVCFERLKKRDRAEETNVPYAFIRSLHDLHEDWLMGSDSLKLPAPVLVLDASQELPTMESVYEQHKSRILCGCS